MKLALPAEKIEELAPRLRELAPGAAWVPIDTKSPIADGSGVVVLLCSPFWDIDALLARLPDLRWVHALSAGVERVIRPEMAKRGIILTNSAGAYSHAMAESVLASILAVAKCLPEHIRNQQEAKWRTYSKTELPGKTLGVLGLGSIGRDAAGLARSLGMRTIGTLRHPRPLPGIDAVFSSGEAPRVAAESDFLLVAAPSTPATQCLVDEPVLRAMRPAAWLINVARFAGR